MALSTITGSAVPSTQSGHVGPFIYDQTPPDLDYLFIVAVDDALGQPAVYRSTNGGTTWAEVDAAGTPLVDNGVGSIAAVQDGNTLHIAMMGDLTVAGMNQTQDVEYYTFDIASATWGLDESVVTINVDGVGGLYGIGIAVRSDGDVIIVHHISERTNMGTNYSQYGYSRREGGSWTTEVPFNAANENQRNARCVMAPNDECHIFYALATTGHGTTLDSANSLSTRITVQSDNDDGFGRPITWDNAGTQQVLVVWWFDLDVHVRRLQEDGSGDLATDLAQAEISDGTDQVPVTDNLALAFDPVDDDAYAFFPSTDTDLFYDVGAQGTGWGTDTEAEDAVTVNNVWAQYYTRDGDDVIGYVIEDGTTLKYNEIVIRVGTPPTYPPFPRRQHRPVRM